MNDSRDLAAALDGSEADLDLLAFCYLTEELAPAAQAAFELRLETEQPAREALARAVELTIALRETSPIERSRVASLSGEVSHPTEQPRAFDRWMRVTTFVAIASAACVAVVIGIRSQSGVFQNSGSVSPETALVWSQVRDSWPESAVAEALSLPASSAESVAFDTEHDLLVEDASDSVSNSEMPGWLLAAVAGPNSEETDAASPDTRQDQVPEEREEL